MVAEKKAKIDKRRLVRELLVIGGVAMVVFMVRFVPWLMEQPIPGYDPYAKYQTLFRDVEKYDYSNGGSESLEARLTKATASIGEGPIEYYFNLKAKVYYYNKVGSYAYSNEVADEAMRFVPTGEEKMFIYSQYIGNYRALGDTEKVAEYEGYYAAIAEIVGS